MPSKSTMGMFPQANDAKQSKENLQKQKDQYQRSQRKAKDDFTEVMENLEEPEFDEEEMLRVGELIRQRQQEALLNR